MHGAPAAPVHPEASTSSLPALPERRPDDLGAVHAAGFGQAADECGVPQLAAVPSLTGFEYAQVLKRRGLVADGPAGELWR